ncbi:MAG: fibronectin type III domain-containing protein [Nitrospira sp.]|nr:fibronectin type III domain-containing protein [Nitrospira sp.]MDH4303118.1 fibronectin type III domain-containing protein [Nitrospira sp.]MDH5192463.1 fibronectin type III domain-containing protein [Nitrospira sp.]
MTWKPNSETDLAGYKVYRSTIRGKYGPENAIALLQKNVTTYQVTGLQPKTTYYFVVTAFDMAGNESGYSNEVSKSIY